MNLEITKLEVKCLIYIYISQVTLCELPNICESQFSQLGTLFPLKGCGSVKQGSVYNILTSAWSTANVQVVNVVFI